MSCLGLLPQAVLGCELLLHLLWPVQMQLYGLCSVRMHPLLLFVLGVKLVLLLFVFLGMLPLLYLLHLASSPLCQCLALFLRMLGCMIMCIMCGAFQTSALPSVLRACLPGGVILPQTCLAGLGCLMHRLQPQLAGLLLMTVCAICHLGCGHLCMVCGRCAPCLRLCGPLPLQATLIWTFCFT